VVDDYTGLLDGNGRVARLARWLRDRPAAEGVDLLVLEVRGEEGYERVQSWPRASVTVALASVIDSLVVDAANEQGSYLTARAMWWDTAKAIAWATFALRVHPEGMGTQQAFSGDAQNINIQFQRNLDRASALHMQCIGETIAMHRDAQDDTRERAQRAERECDELRARLNESERARLDMERRVSELEDDLSAAMELAEESTKKVEETKQEADESSALTRMIAPMLGLAPPIKAS
jgi:hypothetical protein